MNYNHIDYIYFYRTWKGNVPVLVGSSTDFDEILFPTKAVKKVLIERMPSNKNLYVRLNGQNFRVL